VELTRSSQYAVQGLVFLADRSKPEEPVLLRDIAATIAAPEAFLSKIFQDLRAAGIVRSPRGISRGYGLARDPQEISLYDIIVTTAGTATLHAADAIANEMTGRFPEIWSTMESLVAERLRSTTIGALVASGAGNALRNA